MNINGLCQRWQAYLRHLKANNYQDRKFVIFMNPGLHVLVNDFVAYTIDLPEWFRELNLDTDCYEAVEPGSPSGSLLNPEIYGNLIKYFRQFYNVEKAIEIWPPRGCNLWIDSKPQTFIKYNMNKKVESEVPIVTVMPRYRERASDRNVPPFVWKQVIEELKKDFVVVLGGTPSGACLADCPEDDRLINLISYNEDDKLDKLIMYLNNSVFSISSQSGGTHISLLSGCNSCIIGHEKDRHAIVENRIGVPVSFRNVFDYRAIDAETIISDARSFVDALMKENKLFEYQVKETNQTVVEDVKNIHEKIIKESSDKLAFLLKDRNV